MNLREFLWPDWKRVVFFCLFFLFGYLFQWFALGDFPFLIWFVPFYFVGCFLFSPKSKPRFLFFVAVLALLLFFSGNYFECVCGGPFCDATGNCVVMMCNCILYVLFFYSLVFFSAIFFLLYLFLWRREIKK